MASLVRYANVPGNYEDLTFPMLLKEIVVDDVVVSSLKTTFLEAEIYDKNAVLEYLASYKEYVSLLLDIVSGVESAADVSYDHLLLIKLATTTCLDMVTITEPNMD
jgi:hypothetical protein